MSFISSFLLLVIDLSEDPKASLHVYHTRSKTVTLDPQREQGQRGQGE